MYLAKETVAQAVSDLKGTANPLLKVWLTLKVMGLAPNAPVLIDTHNSESALNTLFHSGDAEGRYYVPFASGESKRWMQKDASRSIIQTTVKKWHDGTITTVDPHRYLSFKNKGRKWEVQCTSTYPNGLGEGPHGFALNDARPLALPILQFATWMFCRNEIPEGITDVSTYLCDKLRSVLHLSQEEESRVFSNVDFKLKTCDTCIADEEVYALCVGDAGMSMLVSPSEEFLCYLAAIRTKPFVLLAGISGTGKSRLVRQLATGCCPAENRLSRDDDAKTKLAKRPGNFEMIQVRPNWHDSTQLMGYESRATGHHEYVITPFVSFLAKAWKNLDVPFFLCLDEMNLAPVEQYFAEYLSVIETRKVVGDEIVTDPLVRIEDKDLFEGVLNKLFEAGTDSALVERFKREGGISIPQNLVVMGTVNMDETTFSFSRKVLDRAMSFELNEVDMNGGLEQCPDCGYGTILPEHAKCEFTQGYEVYAVAKDPCDKIKEFLSGVNKLLDKTPFKIAYRTRNEIMIYCHERTKNNVVSLAQALDEATSMKILSRVEGDKRRLVIRDEDYQEYNGRPLLESLGEVIQKGLKAVRGGDSDYTESNVCKVKLSEMIGQLANGYTSFWTR